ncbi:hypothetical protein H8E88_04465 [candidate division KSB1 bacterium]|nr:hypothetical protein [candidate division KSB1 bacterium]
MKFYRKKPSHPTIKKILGFGKREHGWHFGEGVPPSKDIIGKALLIVKKAIKADLDTDAFPGVNGEIMVTIYHKNDYLEFTVEVDGKVTLVHERGEEEISYKEGLEISNALREMKNIGKYLWNISEAFTKTITIRDLCDSKVWLSETHQAQAFLAYPRAVFWPSDTRYVTTSPDITLWLHQLPSFTGHLPSTSYQEDAVSSLIRVIPEMSVMAISWD